MSEGNKAITRRWMEMFNEGNLAIADEILAADFVHYDPTVADIHGIEAAKAAVAVFRGALSGRFTMDDLIAEGDKVAFRWTFTGVHAGEWAGIAATGKPFRVRGAGMHRIANGKLIESWADWDVHGLWKQVGALTDPTLLAANATLIRRYFEEVLNQGNLALIDEIFGDSIVLRAVHMPEIHDRPALKQFIASIRTAFPGCLFHIEDLIAGRDRVVVRWTSAATHRGEFMGIAPTGQNADCQGTNIFRIAGGKIVEQWEDFDALALFQKLGALPPLPKVPVPETV